MLHPKSTTSAVTPKSVIGLSILFLMVAAILGLLNAHKVKALRTNVMNANAPRDAAERRRATGEKDLKGRATAVAAEEAKLAEAENKATKAGEEVGQLQKEKSELQTKLDANQTEIASLQKRIEEATAAGTTSGAAAQPAGNPGAPSPAELQAQLDDARRQLDSAEREKTLLSQKLRPQDQSAQPQQEKKRREVGARKPGVHGTVLAVNQAYNFVVLNLGGHQGVEPNSEMLVLRDGTLIGRIRISSVEPATAIGDIITSSLARGVQVQPGDIVIYAGTNS
jgi:FtsZ-interacting cell division protein ZipA